MEETAAVIVYDPWVHSLRELLLQKRDVAAFCCKPYRLPTVDMDWYSESPIGARTLDIVDLPGNYQCASGQPASKIKSKFAHISSQVQDIVVLRGKAAKAGGRVLDGPELT